MGLFILTGIFENTRAFGAHRSRSAPQKNTSAEARQWNNLSQTQQQAYYSLYAKEITQGKTAQPMKSNQQQTRRAVSAPASRGRHR